MPNNDGGATGVGRQLLAELSRLGVEVDCFFSGGEEEVPEVLRKQKNLRFFCQRSNFEWNRWYSRNNYMAFVTGQMKNLRAEMKLAESLVRQHQLKPYDLVYQFSHIEMHALKKFKRQLPPIVLHPSVHAAGELKWHRKEAHLSRSSEKLVTRMLVRLLLTVRSRVQYRHIRDADYILSISRNFAAEMQVDYRLDPDKVSLIVPNPIDVEKFSPKPGLTKFKKDARITLLFVSRIAVRKGTEMVVELSKRLDDMSDRVHILVVGNKSLWSDYRGLLKELNPKTATYLGPVPGREMESLYNSVDGLLHPAHYEPFGLTVGEALACGKPVVSSDKVGASEGVSEECCRLFPAGDMDAMEREVRRLVAELETPRKDEIARTARSEAIRLYSDSVIATHLVSILEDVTKKSRPNEKWNAQRTVPLEV